MAAERLYPEPVSQLLTLGMPEYHGWRNYHNLGLGPEHIPELIQLATDTQLLNEWEDTPENWAPYHAWRALGQFEAAQAVAPLIPMLDRIDDEDDDWAPEDLPEVFAAIGPPAVPALADYLNDLEKGPYGRAAAGEALEKIAARHPASYAECVAALTRALENYASNDESLNGFLVSNLVELHAVDAAPLMERAFASGRVDEMVMGDWEDVQVKLGLLSQRQTPSRRRSQNVNRLQAGGDDWQGEGPILTVDKKKVNQFQRKAEKKDKARRKQEKKSRQKNRKKK